MAFYSVQEQEDRDYEVNARYDYITEAFAGMAEDPAMLAYEAEADYAEWDAEMTAAFGPVVLAVRSEDIPF